MSNYSKATDFAAKDALTTGDPDKIIKGTPIDDEYNAISVAIATKANSASPTFTGTVTLANVTSSGTITASAFSGDGSAVTGVASAATAVTLTGLTSTIAELNFSDGVTSNIQTQLGAKAATAGPTFTGTVTLAKVVFGAEIVETTSTLSGTTPSVDPANGTIQEWTLTGNSTPTDVLADGEYVTLLIDDGTAYTITWTIVDEWIGGSTPTLDTTNTNVIEIWKVGTIVYGSLVGVAS